MDKQPGSRTKLTSFLRNEDGVMAVVFAVLLPVFVVMAALAIDMGYSYWKRNMLQVDASVAALAGAGRLMDDGVFDPVNEIVIYAFVDRDGDGIPDNLDTDGEIGPDGAVIFNEALLYAESNIPNEDILAAVDLHAGNWEATTRKFTSAGTWDPITLVFDDSQQQEYDAVTGTITNVGAVVPPLNAVLAFTRRADDGPNNNPLPLFLAAAVGLPEVNINTAAIATVGPQTTIEFNGCLMCMNPDEDQCFYANGNNNPETNDCDIYVNSNAECAMDLIGNTYIEVGSEESPGSIYIVGEYCENPNVTINCNQPDTDGDGFPDGACPETGAAYQADPYAYTHSDAYMATSGLSTLQDLQCGKHYINDGFDYTDSVDLSAFYANPDHTGLGNFKIDGQIQPELFGGAPIACNPPVGDPDSGLLTDDGVTCVVPALYPAGDSNVGDPMIFGTKVVTDFGDWSWNIANQRFEFAMEPGAYCGGIEARGFGTVVFAEGNYILKGKEAVDPPIVGGPNPNEFDLRAKVAVEGFNVAFYLADEYIDINWGGGADVSLIGRNNNDPADPLNGFLFYAEPGIVDADGDCISGCNEGPHFLRGTPAAGMQGILYFPMGDVSIRGTAGTGLVVDGSGVCTILVTDTVEFRGTTTFYASTDGCVDFGIPPPGAQLVLRLVH